MILADYFTSASDVFAERIETKFSIGVPPNIVQSDAEAVVIALKSRSIAADEAVTKQWERKLPFGPAPSKPSPTCGQKSP